MTTRRRPVLGASSAALFLLLCFTTTTSFAQTVDTELGHDIGTSVADVFGDGSNIAVSTSIASVTYAQPVLINRDKLSYYEVLGSVQGTGWGGAFQDLSEPPFPPPGQFPSLSHYAYSVPLVLRWPIRWDGTLVHYAHGTSPLSFSVFFESMLGEDNEARRFDIVEGQFLSDAVMSPRRRHAFFAINLSGLDRDGQFSAIATEGPFAGLPVNPSVDVPISRDLSLVAERLLEKLTSREVERSIGVGHSGGALIMQWIASGLGFSLDAGVPLFDGGNFVKAYDPGSGTILEGVISLAGGGFFPVHPDFPLTARAILIGGDGDFANVDHVRYAGRLLRAGIDLNESVRIYHISNLPHNFAEIVESTPNQNQLLEELFAFTPSPDSERMAPVVAAAIDNMSAWLESGTPPPKSWVNGQPGDDDDDGTADRIVFTQAGDQTTSLFPFVADPAIDTLFGDQFELSDAGGFPGTVTRYVEVLEALDHVSGSVSLPYERSRLGGYLLAGDATLVPFPDLDLRWRSFGTYKASVHRTINDLAHEGLYDPILGRDVVFTDEILALFGR